MEPVQTSLPNNTDPTKISISKLHLILLEIVIFILGVLGGQIFMANMNNALVPREEKHISPTTSQEVKIMPIATPTQTPTDLHTLISYTIPKGWVENNNPNQSLPGGITIISPIDKTKAGGNSTGSVTLIITRRTVTDSEKEYQTILHPVPYPTGYQQDEHANDYSKPVEEIIGGNKALYVEGGFESYSHTYMVFFKDDIWTINFRSGFPLTDTIYTNIRKSFVNSISFTY